MPIHNDIISLEKTFKDMKTNLEFKNLNCDILHYLHNLNIVNILLLSNINNIIHYMRTNIILNNFSNYKISTRHTPSDVLVRSSQEFESIIEKEIQHCLQQSIKLDLTSYIVNKFHSFIDNNITVTTSLEDTFYQLNKIITSININKDYNLSNFFIIISNKTLEYMKSLITLVDYDNNESLPCIGSTNIIYEPPNFNPINVYLDKTNSNLDMIIGYYDKQKPDYIGVIDRFPLEAVNYYDDKLFTNCIEFYSNLNIVKTSSFNSNHFHQIKIDI